MATQLFIGGYDSGISQKQSAADCVNYIPYPTTQNDLSGGIPSVYTTTGIEGPLPGSGVFGTPSYLGGQVYSFANSVFCLAQSGSILRISENSFTGYALLVVGPNPYRNTRIARMASSRDRMVTVVSNSEGVSGVASFDAVANTLTAVDISAIATPERSFLTDTAFFGARFLYLSSEEVREGVTTAHYARIYYSKINDPDIEDSLSFIGDIDDIGALRGMEVINDRLYVFSSSTMIVFNRQNSQTVPFIEQQGSAVDVGLLSSNSKLNLSGTLFCIGYIGGSIKLLSMSGGQVSVISTPAIDDRLNSGTWFSSPSLAAVFSFSDNGRTYIAFSFDSYTFCYDPSTGLFHRRSTNGGRWEVIGSGDIIPTAAGGDGVNFMVSSVIPSQANRINAGRGSTSIGTEFGQVVDRECVTSNFNSNNVVNRVPEVQIIADIDNQPLIPAHPSPRLLLSASDSYAYDFEQEESERFGSPGDRDNKIRFHQVGVFPQAFTLKLRTLNPYPHRIIKILAVIKKGIRQR